MRQKRQACRSRKFTSIPNSQRPVIPKFRSRKVGIGRELDGTRAAKPCRYSAAGASILKTPKTNGKMEQSGANGNV